MKPLFFKRQDEYVKPPIGFSYAKLLFVDFPTVLYCIISLLYVAYFILTNNSTTDRIESIIAIAEIILTVFSILVSIIATVVSDRQTDEYQKYVERINRQNEPLYSNAHLKDAVVEKLNDLSIIRKFRRKLSVVFVLLMLLSFLYNITKHSDVVQLCAIISGALSTICSIVLAMTSSLTCVISTRYANMLLSTVMQANEELADQLNTLRIERSYKSGNSI